MSNTYGDWLRAQRETAGLTQQQLADMAIMTRSHISHIEGGRRVPSREDARRLDRALGTGDVLSSFLPRQDDVAVADYFGAAQHLEQQASSSANSPCPSCRGSFKRSGTHGLCSAWGTRH